MIYEYECVPCQEHIEIHMTVRKYEDICGGYLNQPSCPDCGAKLKRIITKAPNFHLKGSGWAKDGYASNGDTNAN